MNTSEHSIVLVLSGGNALGAYHAGGYQALHDRGVRPDWVIGTSTGAINGAIICGNAEEDRLAHLAEYWGISCPQSGATASPWWPATGEDMRRTAAASAYLMFGQPTTFAPRVAAGTFWLSADTASPSLFDTKPLAATLKRLVDFEHLNSSTTRFTATAVDLENGGLVTFDTASQAVSAQHVLASGALLPAFPPVEIGGRLMGDGGLAANLPVHAAGRPAHQAHAMRRARSAAARRPAAPDAWRGGEPNAGSVFRVAKSKIDRRVAGTL